MGKRFTLFTGQWIDLTLEEVAELAAGWGYDGLEIAVLRRAPRRVAGRRGRATSRGGCEILRRHGLECWAISNHLTGQAVCDDPIDFRHQAIVRDRVWGDGDPEGVRQRAAEEMRLTARLAQEMGVDTVVGFTGSSIWRYVAMFPPVPAERIDGRLPGLRGPVEPDPRRVRPSAACGSPTRCTRPRSPTTTGRRCRLSRRSTTVRSSGSTGTRAT